MRDAQHSGFLRLEALADVLDRFPRHPAAARLRPFVGGAVPPTDSDLEAEFLEFCERHGLPTPETGAYIAGHRTDALFREQRLIVEIDSHEYHRDMVTFESDRDRDADTLAVDFATIRVTAERMRERPLREADRLRRILRRRGWTG